MMTFAKNKFIYIAINEYPHIITAKNNRWHLNDYTVASQWEVKCFKKLQKTKHDFKASTAAASKECTSTLN